MNRTKTLGGITLSIAMVLAAVPSQATLLGFDNSTNELLEIDPATGLASAIGPGIPFSTGSLAYVPSSGRLYAYQFRLYEVDPVTGQSSLIGPAGGGSRVSGLAYDSTTNVLYGADYGTNDLLIIDPTSGIRSSVGNIGPNQISALAYDAGLDTLYGIDNITDELISIDRSSGVGSVIGSLGFGAVNGLAIDPVSGTLFGADLASDQLIQIDKSTGLGTAIGSLGFANVEGLTFVPEPGTAVLLGLGLAGLAVRRTRSS